MLKNSSGPPRITRGRALSITAVAVVIVYLLWNVPALSPLAYPFRLFVTYVHEAGHALAALATGGRVIGFSVSADGSGLATTAGGSRAVILPAGYLGAALFGALLFYVVNTRPYARTISIVLGVALVIFTVLYARPDSSGVPVALFIGLLVGGGLIALGWKVNSDINLLVLNVLALMTALNAVMDVTLLIRHSDVVMVTQHGIVRNDAAAFSQEVAPWVPAAVWAVLWAAIAIAMVGAAIYFSIVRPWIVERQKRAPGETQRSVK